MKQLLILLLLCPALALSQLSNIDLGIDGKDLTDIQFLKEGELIVLKSSEGGGPYKKESNVVIRKVDLKSNESSTVFESEKDIDVDYFNSNGCFVLTGTSGFIGYGKKHTSVFLNEDGSISGELKSLGSRDIYRESTFITDEFLISIGPIKKGYKSTKKLKGDKPVSWLLYRVDLETLKESITPITLNSLSGKENEIGYTFLGYSVDGIYLMHKNFKNTSEGKNPNEQDLIITQISYNGEILNETPLLLSIDSGTHRFSEAGLKGGYEYKSSASGPSYRLPISPSTGTVYIDLAGKSYYVVALLTGNKSSDGMFVNITKFDFSGEKEWNVLRKFKDKAPNEKEIKYISFDPVLIDSRLYFKENNVAYKSSEGIDIYSIDPESGNVDQTNSFEKLKTIAERSEVWHTVVSGSIVPDELSENVVLDDQSLIAYSVNENFKEFLKSSEINNETFFYTFFRKNGDIATLQVNYKTQEYKLLLFNGK